MNDPALPQESANGEVALIPGMGYNAGGVDKVGFVLIALGAAVVVGYAAIAFFTAVAVPLWFRIAISAIVLGLLLVLVSALWGRRKVSAEESFREVKR